MTTDYTSALINQNIKTAATEGRSFRNVGDVSKTDAFDSVFENVSKTYADKSEITQKKSKLENYASATKNADNAQKSSAQKNQKRNVQRLQNSKANNVSDNNTSANKPYNQQTEKINKPNSFDNITQKAETINTHLSRNTNNADPVKNSTLEQTESSVNSMETDNQLILLQENSNISENSFDVQETLSNNDENILCSTEEDEISKRDDSISNQQLAQTVQIISNEQVIANFIQEQNLNTKQIDVVENVFNVDSLQLEQDSLKVQTAETFNSKNDNLTSLLNSFETELNTFNNSGSYVQDVLFQQDNLNVRENFLNNIAQNIPEVAKNNFSNELFSQAQTEEFLNANLQSDMTQLLENYIDNSTVQVSDDIDVEIKNTNLQISGVETRVQKTVQENLASDTSRFTVNLQSDVPLDINEENLPLITPTQTKQDENIDTAQAVIQVTDNVAEQALNNFSNRIENRDFSGEVKDKISAKLGELQGTSTVVTDVQYAQSNMSSDMSNSHDGNNSLTQGNATEQAIKLSVENISSNEISQDDFISQLEAKLNSTVKTVNSKQTNVLNKSDILSQLNTKFNEMQQAGQNKVSMILKPENLGRVSVEIMSSKDGIIAKMTTDNQQVRELLDRNIEALRANLSSQGVNVNNIKVECTNQSENNAMDFERQQFEQNSQDFQNQNSNGGNHTNNSNRSNESVFTESLMSNDEIEESAQEITAEQITTTETTLKHNGKIDYKV